MVFEGTTGVYERFYCFNIQMSKKERETDMRIRDGFEEFFLFTL